MKGLLTLLVVVVVALSVVFAQGPYAGQELSSNIFRVSPFGACSSPARLRSNLYPCFADRQFTFPNLTVTNSTVPKITSLLGLDVAGIRTLYVGNANLIQVVRPNVTFVNNTVGVTIQNITTTGRGDFVGSFSDGTTYVAFVSAAGVVLKYPLLGDGTLNASAVATAATGVASPTAVITNALPTVVIAGSKSVSVVDAAALTFNTSTFAEVPAGTVGTINCGAAANADASIIFFSASNGIVFTFDRNRQIILGSIATGASFGRSCAARYERYGVFFTTGGSIYQVGYSLTTLSAATYISEGVGQPGQTVGVSAINADSTSVFVIAYTPGGSNNYLDNIYEFRLYEETYDFASVIQQDQTFPNVFIDPTTISAIVGNSIYIGASGTQIPRTYELLVNRINNVSDPNVTHISHLVPDFTLPTNPTGSEGKTNAIADVTRTYSNGDLIFGNGVGFFPSVTVNANDTSSIPSRGATTTYLRGTQSNFPRNGGGPNTNGIAFKLVSLDEVTGAARANASVTLIRSMPFYTTTDAPWVAPRDSNQQANGQNAGVTGITWTVGRTDTVALAGTQYNYMMPPRASVVNNSIPTQQPLRGKRSPAGPNQFTPGYISMAVTLSTFGTNTTRGSINDVAYNVTSRTFLYTFSVTNYAFLSNSNFLRLTIAVGLGADGNTSLGSGILGANSTLTPIIPGYLIYTETADWTLLLPQKASVNSRYVNSPANCVYDTSSQMMSLYLPVAAANTTISYTFAVEYEYIAPIPPLPSFQDGGGPKLLPLWIVIGVVGGLLIIAVIIAIIVIIVVYKVAGDKIKAWIVDSQFDQTEGALREDRGPF